MSSIVLITGASSGFGALTARALADADHTVYAGIRDTAGHNRSAVADAATYATAHSVDLRTIELDVSDQASVDTAVSTILANTGRHRRPHSQRRAHGAGPRRGLHPRTTRRGLRHQRRVHPTGQPGRTAPPTEARRRPGSVVGSTSTRGGTPPYLGPYFAAKAAEDALAVSYAAELARFGIDTTIVVPGSFTTGTNHFVHAGHPDDDAVADAYEQHYAGLMDQVGSRLAELAPADADPTEVAWAIVRVVDTPAGQRPFRVHIDPADDGAELVNTVGDHIRRDFYHRIGLADLLRPTT